MGKHVSAHVLANTWHEYSPARVIEAEWEVHLFYRTCYAFEHPKEMLGIYSMGPLFSKCLHKVYATRMGFYSVACNDMERVPGE